MSALPTRYFTPHEYAMLEAKAGYRSQFVAGELFLVEPAQPWHDRIVNNLSGMLYVRQGGRDLTYHSSSVRVWTEAGALWTYPDLCLLAGKPQYETKFLPYTLLNPQVLFEVLSAGTQRFDQGDKFHRYRSIETLTDYVLVASEKRRVEHYVRQANGDWIYREYNEGTDVLKLRSVEVEFPLAEIYERVIFPQPDEDV